jgi:hypothetical protein
MYKFKSVALQGASLAFLFVAACTFDTSGLSVTSNNASCGNGVLEAGERCDGAELDGQTCVGLGFDGGMLTCRADCGGFDTSRCEGTGPVCGDGAITGLEVCDGDELGGHNCVSQGFLSGELACAADCLAFDASGCEGTGPVCGNGVLEGTEVCDGANLDGQTCATQGFLAGVLACATNCLAFDASGCEGTGCGNGVIEGDELCDGAALSGQTCETQGFVGGVLACATNCLAWDTTACLNQDCGNGVIEEPEVCDGDDLAGKTCATQGFFGGELTCNAGCMTLNTSDCTMCGNEQVDSGEVCDGTAGITQTCQDLGCRAGTVTCLPDCSAFTTATCFSGHDEDADGVDDNCDNCPTWYNPASGGNPQADADHDGLGNACEAPVDDAVLDTIVTFDPFTSNNGNWSSDGGSWSWGADHVTGSETFGAYYFHNLQMSGSPVAVEATYYYPEDGALTSNYAGVVFGVQTGTFGVLTAGWACTFERDDKQLGLFKYVTTGWSQQASVPVSTTAGNGQWRRLRAIHSNTGVRCQYVDEAGGAANVSFTDSMSIGALSGKVGLRLYNERAVFTSFIT